MRKSLSLLAVAALALAACDDNDNDDDNGGGNGNGGARGIETLGDGFVAAFNADPNDEPVDASEVDLELMPRATPFDP